MIKMSLFITRRSDLTREHNDYWLNKHWPIVQTLRNLSTFAVMSNFITLAKTPQGMAALPFHGVAEAWLDSMDDFYTALTSKYWPDVIQKDELKFHRSFKNTNSLLRRKSKFQSVINLNLENGDGLNCALRL